MPEVASAGSDHDGGGFAQLADPFRGQLLAHCYRMLGSVHDAEDVVQETYVRAWRGYDRFEGRSSLRTWLFRIATKACLTAIERRGRRPLPSGLGSAGADEPRTDVPWLQPIPDALVEEDIADPAEIVTSRQRTRLAFVAALQLLPGRQRAVLILRDVLRWRAVEVAELLDTTTAAVNSALQRARSQLAQAEPAEDMLAEPTDPDRRELLDRYAMAFENTDIPAITRLLAEDARLEMPPDAVSVVGGEAIGDFLAARLPRPGDTRMTPTAANGQPAFAQYRRDDHGFYRAHSVHVLTLGTSAITRITVFRDPSLFDTFDLPIIGA